MLIKLKGTLRHLKKKIFPMTGGPENKERYVAATFWSESRMTCLRSEYI